MTMQTQKPMNIFKVIVGLLTIFGVLGFTASIVNLVYSHTVSFDFIWLTVGCMVIGMILLGVLRK